MYILTMQTFVMVVVLGIMPLLFTAYKHYTAENKKRIAAKSVAYSYTFLQLYNEWLMNNFVKSLG